jgi:peptide/nickel transport system permease protein
MIQGRWWRRNAQGVLGITVLGAVIVIAAAAPLISPRDPNEQNLRERLEPPAFTNSESASYALGSDHLGRDVLSRLCHGARISLLVGFAAVACAGTLGVLMGLSAGYFGGILETGVVAVADAQLALPYIVLAIAMAATLGPTLTNVILALTITGWVVFARVARGETLSVSARTFVEAARSIGATDRHIILRHILPNVMPTITVVATVQVARMILMESALSFLGVGVPVDTPTWGAMLSDGRNYLREAPWIATFPGLAITTTVVGVNFVGNWLRELMNPWRKETR